MKNILLIIAALFAASTVANAQTKAVLKNINGGTITESLTIGSGKTLTIAGGATINATGATITGFTASAAWGGITGTLSAQTDLQSALNAKQSTSAGLTRLLTLTTTNMTGGTFEMTTGSLLRLKKGDDGVEFTGGSGGTINMIGQPAAFDRNGGNAGIIQTSGSNEFNGGSLSLQSNGLNNAGSIDTTAGGSLTMGTASLDGGSVAGTILTTAGDGSSLTSLNASNLASGTVGTARLGTGTANSTTYLRGDGTWATVTGGVTSITGTAGQITVTGTTTPTLSLPATITGLTSVTSTTFVGALTGTASGNAVLTGNAFNGANTTTVGTNSATPAAAESLTNSTAAISGTQSASPSVIWTGQGWKTTATAASQAVAYRAYVLPVQGAANPTGLWTLQSSINGAAYSTLLTVDSSGLLTATSGMVAADFRFQAGAAGSIISLHGGNILFKSNDEYVLKLYGSSRNVVIDATGGFGWSGGSGGSPYSGDAGLLLEQESANVVQVNNGTTGTRRDISLRNLIHTDYIEGTEMTAPSAPAANKGRLYFEDNGSGKTRLMVIFPSGAAQQIAIEP